MLSKFISTVGFIGYSPFAPGTAGTLAGLLVMALLRPSLKWHIILSVAAVIIGIISSNNAEEIFKKKDPGCVVIDEFAGYILCLLFLPFNWKYMTAAFFLFRIFDIIKPPPLNRLQYLKGGIGIMADDVGAAVYTNLLLQAWRFIFA